MQSPSPISLLFLGYVLVLLPALGIRSARVLDSRDPSTPLPPRTQIWAGTLLSLAILLALAIWTGRSFDYDVFAVGSLDARDWVAAAAALAVCFIVREVSRRLRKAAERRQLVVFKLAPRTRREWSLWAAAVVAAGIGEEAAYRGVAMSILWYSLGNPWIAALICSVAFAAAHWPQGLFSGVIVFAIAVLMHALVALTGTLVLAMIVHAAYDFVAGYLIAREAARFDQEATSASAVAISSGVL